MELRDGCRLVVGQIEPAGVETEIELHKIMNMETDYIQGYYYSRPCSLDELKYKLENHLIIKEA